MSQILEAPWVLFRLLYGTQGVSLGHMIAGLDFCRGLIVQGFMDSGGIPPVHPVHRLELDFGDCGPGRPSIDQFSLI